MHMSVYCSYIEFKILHFNSENFDLNKKIIWFENYKFNSELLFLNLEINISI